MKKLNYHHGFAISVQSYVDADSGVINYRYEIYKPIPLTTIQSPLQYESYDQAFEAAKNRIDEIILRRSAHQP